MTLLYCNLISKRKKFCTNVGNVFIKYKEIVQLKFYSKRFRIIRIINYFTYTYLFIIRLLFI